MLISFFLNLSRLIGDDIAQIMHYKINLGLEKVITPEEYCRRCTNESSQNIWLYTTFTNCNNWFFNG